ncbi:MAG: transporter substrate-binding domain-containing protein [Burkholderiaceae bacterium]|nr:transporter substrate-binding domain-containing protein [Burkholderiaceae bacterium]
MTSPDSLQRAFAPTGALRASINVGNAVLAASGADGPTGVSVDLARELARRLGVTPEFVVVDNAGKSVANVRDERADVGFFAIDPARAQNVRFTAAYVHIEGCYLVRDASPLRSNDEVDAPGRRVVVGADSAYDLFLTKHLAQAAIERAPTAPAVVDRFLSGGAEVAAGVRQQLEMDAARIGGLRLLPGRFMVIEQTMGLPATRGAQAHAFLRGFVEEMKATGFVARALHRHGVEGAAVAPPA